MAVKKNQMKFKKFVDCVNYVKKSTYLIARWSAVWLWIKRETLWTGVIVNWQKMLTCAHVVEWHKDGQQYYFIRHDELDNVHVSIFRLELWKNLFVFENFDLAIIYINKWFYEAWDRIFKDVKECLIINTEPQNIWTDVGVLWYPLCKLEFFNKNELQPNIWNIIIRTDKWVINWKYRKNNVIYNNFTMQFNEWNSWGPIFSPYDGSLIWLVNWYTEIPIKVKPIIINEELSDGSKKVYKSHDIHNAYYSTWIPVENYFEILKEHWII